MTNSFISVIICTRNRGAYLEDALLSVIRQTYPRSSYEILLVDNGSVDDTRARVERLADMSDAPVRYCFEAIPGLSLARNRGAAMARGEILAYLDDDAIAEPDWLENLDRAWHGIPSNHIGAIAGRVDLLWETARPGWLSPRLDGYLSATTYDYQTYAQLPHGMYPVGANVAVSKERLERLGGFATTLGRIGNSLLSNEEVELCRRLRDCGLEIWYAPATKVRHRIPASRAKISYLLKRAYWQGVSDSILGKRSQVDSAPLWRICLAAMRDFLACTWRLFKAAAHGGPNEAFCQLCYMSSRLGRFSAESGLQPISQA